MHPALALLWFLPSIVFGVGTVITIIALRRAPEGFENEEGFHYVQGSDVRGPIVARGSMDVMQSGELA